MPQTPTLAPTLKLNHGAEIPQLGIGTSPMGDAETERAVATALGLGYRLIDTAENYRNEAGVGRAIASSGIPRDEIFVTTKFNKRWHSVDGAREAFEQSAERLGLDMIDLLLIHWPNPGQDRYVDAWRGIAALHEQGLVRAVGTSNFKPAHLQRLIDETGVVPDVNQIELNPEIARTKPRAFHAEHGIVTESWSPMGRRDRLFGLEPIAEAARAHGRSPGQIVVRWHIQSGLVVIPKSSNGDRLADNLAVFDFELIDKEMAAIDALDRGESAARDSDAQGH
jgi:2,5-diketo-D-gluconate reductase A